ncbi:MAG: DNA primase [Proteobacteria bacterium]|nr:DNA primase [Pseudomonadota bacterium]
MRRHGLEGLGFVFTTEDPFVGIDFDACRNTETGEIDPGVQDIVNRMNSYTEISPSGTGLHIIAKGVLPDGGKRKDHIEMYDQGRFFTVTGYHLPGTPKEVSGSPEVEALYHQLRNEKISTEASSITVAEVLESGREVEQVEKFNKLWAGDWSDYPSQSEADLAFCAMLNIKTGNNSSETDRLFRESGLYRDKWERQDYREKCLSRAKVDNVMKLPSAVGGFNLTDLGNSKRLINEFGENIRYCVTAKEWLVWNGQNWEVDYKAETSRMARVVVKNMYLEASTIEDEVERKKIAQHAMKTESLSRLNAIKAMAKDDFRVRVRAEDLDKDHWALNCQNGTIDLKTGELLPHDPKKLITKIVPTDYLQETDCPAWKAFLHTIMGGNEEMIQFLQRAVGYSLTGDTSEQCFFILYGSGANGKSTFLNPLIHMLNDYAKQSPPETFLNLQRRGVNNDIARLKDARFVTATEPEANQSFAEGVLKQLTGGDTVSARFLHQEFFDFKPVFKLFLATNHKPHVTGKDHGIWRRIRLVPFEVTIPKEAQDPKLTQKLKEELPGILAWAVCGCLDWQANGLGQPQAVVKATEEYAREMDSLTRFVEDCCVTGAMKKVSTNDLYSSYSSWCEQEGEESLPKIAFARQVRGKGFSAYRTSTERGWRGVGIKDLTLPPSNILTGHSMAGGEKAVSAIEEVMDYA